MELAVKQSAIGRGVFSVGAIARGTQILRYTGPLLTYAQTSPTTLAVQVARDLYLGASGNPDDYVNHSCNPNCGLVINDPSQVILVAIRDIRADEELFFDYSTTMDEDDFEMRCQCSSAGCRQLIRDFKHLPMELKRYYACLGIVPDYNLKYIAPSA